MAIPVGLDAHRGHQGQQLHPLGHGALHLLGHGGHIHLAAAVDAGDLLRPQAHGAAGHVHGHVAAADDHHPLAGEVRQLVVPDLPEHLHGGDDPPALLPGDAGLLVRLGADGDVDAVVLAAQLLKGDVLPHVHLGVDGNAQGENGVDLPVQLLPGEAVAGDAVAEHAAQLAALLVDGDLVAHEGQVVGGGEAAGPAADDGHPLACGLRAQGLGHVSGGVHGVALQPPDVHGVVDHVPAAPGLAGVLADIGAGHGEGVVLADEPHRVGAAARADQGDVSGDVHPRRAQGHAGHRVLQAAQAAVVVDVLPVVVGKALQAVEHQPGGVLPDGAGGGLLNGAGGVGDDLHVPGLGPAVQHIGQKCGELGQPYPAGDALAAGLGVAQVQEVQRHVHRAQARRRGGNPALHIVVELLHHHLGPVRRLDIQSAHGRYRSFRLLLRGFCRAAPPGKTLMARKRPRPRAVI